MESNEEYPLLVEWLKTRGHNEQEIQQILDKVRQYDAKMMHDSVMDSIGSGRITFEALVEEALKE